MIKAVFFDYGGVLSPGGLAGCVPEAIASVYGTDVAVLENDHDILSRATRGEISETEYYDELNRRHPDGPRLNRANYLAAQDIFVKSDSVYVLASKLRSHGIQTGILSNINDIAANELRAKGFYDGFDPIVLSFEEKVAKPEKQFYITALQRVGVSANEAVLIDDQDRCRPPADELGMHFILATSPQQIVADTTALMQRENNLSLK
jgi:FMN phosphatase YigB (HAD superfamily)